MRDGNVVLIVDDDPSMLSSLKRVLRQQGFDPVVFESAAGLRAHDGVERARCMVLDINLKDGVRYRIAARTRGRRHNPSGCLYYGE
jgi:FixJ family two-component response regulator